MFLKSDVTGCKKKNLFYKEKIYCVQQTGLKNHRT